ncbi:MAG: TIGR01212 family radical SAM protein [Kiritimatiellia bacterium]|nr:TIGR01212 family radical SAM protein [Kiritimatiellia bacterium]
MLRTVQSIRFSDVDAPYYTYKQYLIDTYGHRVYRVPVDLGWGCPNREDDGSGGCTFCPGDGARGMQITGKADIAEQVRAGVDFARERYGVEYFMAYIQAFTGTHADLDEQERQYRRVLASYPFESLTIGTRPDCLPEPTLDLLSEFRQEVDVIVELGVQTVHDATLDRIRRGHDWTESQTAIDALTARGIRVIAHVILGLPGETPEHFARTADTLAQLPLDGVKIHNLHVIRGTALADEYEAHPFPTMDEDDYAEELIGFIQRLPPNMAILRIRTDTPKEDLIAPRWHLKKGGFIHMIEQRMRTTGRRQGDLSTDNGD